MKIPLRSAFRADVSLHEDEQGSLNIHGHTRTCQLPSATPGLRSAVQTLVTTGATEEQLTDLILASDGIAGLPLWYYWYQQFKECGYLCYVLQQGATKYATLTAISPDFMFASQKLEPTTKFVLSRFTYCRRDPDGQGLLIESPLSLARLVLHEGIGGALLTELSTPKTSAELAATLPESDVELTTVLLSLFASANLLTADTTAEADALPYWEFHDLLFHSRSRAGRHDAPCGGTFRFGKHTIPAPVVKHSLAVEGIDLYRPDIEQLKEHDIPFTRVLEERRSIRTYNEEHPLTLEQLGEFLYRVARLRQILEPNERRLHTVSNRPYPNGGALYELEIYVTVNRCSSLAPGLYHYDPQNHRLYQIADVNPFVNKLLLDATIPATDQRNPARPHVLLTVTSRFPRVSWKYQSIAYALTLKNAGVLCQTMYLVATAMGLAPTALGSGDSEAFAKASGIDGYEEIPVIELALGT